MHRSITYWKFVWNNKKQTMKFSAIILSSTLTAFLLFSCAISPVAWTPPTKPEFEGQLQLNEKLTKAEKINLLGYYGAEEFAIDSNGNIFCGVHKTQKDFSSGAILKIQPSGNVSVFMETDHWVTGMQFDHNGNLIALMQDLGLVQINTDKSIDTLLTETPNNQPIKMGTGLKIASDGIIYFANMSSTNSTSPKYINQLILEMKPTGGVYSFDPKLNKTSVISTGNYFGNGLALSPKEDYILVTETSKYRIIKYWIKGENKGKSEIFMDNLPGFPNNIIKSESGDFWLGFTTKRNDQLDNIQDKKALKKLIYALPSFVQPKAEKFGMVLKLSEDGEIIQSLFDSKGITVTEAGSILEHDGYLFLGGDVVSYISKINIKH